MDVQFEPYNVATARWLRGAEAELKKLVDKNNFNIALDGADEYVYLAPNRVNLNLAQEKFPEIRFLETREVF